MKYAVIATSRLARVSSLAVVILLTVITSLWAADGWYLLIPPQSSYNARAPYLSGYKILSNKPLSQWGQLSAYDSAEYCEAVKESRTNVEQNVYMMSSAAYIEAQRAGKDLFALKLQRGSAERANANVSAFMASRCIRSDDPRLRR